MKKFLNIFFVVLGVIFFVLIIAGAVMYFADPFGLREAFGPAVMQQANSSGTDTNAASAGDKNPALSATQEKALETFGIDPAAVPTSITPEQEACFVSILGEARVAEIKAGGIPTPAEYYRAKGCVQ